MSGMKEADLQYVCQAFTLGGLHDVQRVARGAMGAVWRIDVSSPVSTSLTTYAGKELFWEIPSADAVVDEVRFVDACRDAGVPSPTPLATPDGDYLVTDMSGRVWRLYEWVDGRVPELSDEDTVRWLAAQIGHIHALGITPPAGVEPHPFYQRVDVDWESLAGDAAASGTGWAPDLEAKLDQLVELSDLVNTAPDDEPVMCHRDPKATNVLQDAAGRRWLVDWDNSGPMDPARELGLLLMHHLNDVDALRSISATYREHGGVPTLHDAHAFATGLAVWLNFLYGQARVVLDADTTDDDRRFAEPRVTGLLHTMPTLAQLERAAMAVAS
ncbi:phosphotransferase enzyme family protein [Phytoactinopolyspora halotolerans]|uniref:Aminoglycoside phosphotransferase family protein n=1 Tax=Phytoactinopolyspora halotolerans TaxID=1981512 RepID=A0A6L9SFM1_9ACTN|nr:aminoglycoside phosphotransferase family protein [Phytoactinopolyspora halotolerans]NEE03428.1 aminoglycoside phosphotransferase family protein [Phytoactinopolyspora halotolerans]